jgi:hypothetical protein
MGAIVAGLVVVGVAAGLNHLRRTRGRVMDYHHVETPRVNESTHGGGGSDG